MSETDRPILNVTCPNPECRHPLQDVPPRQAWHRKGRLPEMQEAVLCRYRADITAPADNSEHRPSGFLSKRHLMTYTASHVRTAADNNIYLKGGGRNLLKVTCPKCKGNISVSVDRPTPQTELVSIGNDSFEE